MNKDIVSENQRKGYVLFKATGTDKGMNVPDNRRSFRLIKRTEERKKGFDEGATAARKRHKIDVEGIVKKLPPAFMVTKDDPSRHIHPRHKRGDPKYILDMQIGIEHNMIKVN